MKEQNLPSYTDLELALANVDIKLHASQVHGLLCGIYLGSPQSDVQWEMITGGEITDQAQEMLLQVYQASSNQLKDFLFQFQLMLPEESEALPLRAEALTLWCQGVLTGLKMAKPALFEREPDEVSEAVNDLVEIAKMKYEEVIPSEEDEAAYCELVEYVRMAIILIYQELQGEENLTSQKSSTGQIH